MFEDLDKTGGFYFKYFGAEKIRLPMSFVPFSTQIHQAKLSKFKYLSLAKLIVFLFRQ